MDQKKKKKIELEFHLQNSSFLDSSSVWKNLEIEFQKLEFH